MGTQLTLALPVATRAEAERRGLTLSPDITAADAVIYGAVGAALANLRYQLERAAEAGLEVVVSVAYQDVASGPRVAVVTGAIGRPKVRV